MKGHAFEPMMANNLQSHIPGVMLPHGRRWYGAMSVGKMIEWNYEFIKFE